MKARDKNKGGARRRSYVVGLGANLGERANTMAAAVRKLLAVPSLELVARSSLYESAPVGPTQPRFYNAAVKVTATMPPRDLLGACKRIERELGRERGERWGPRPIDLDLLWTDEIVAEPELQVPHLELHKRAFALIPLLELEPDAVHPVFKEPLKTLLARLGEQDVTRVGEFYVEG